MKQYLMCFLLILILTTTSISVSSSKAEIKEDVTYFGKISDTTENQNYSCQNTDIYIYKYPSNNNPTTTLGVEIYDRKWDADRNYWLYRMRFDWYQTKYSNGQKDRDPYVYFQVDYYYQDVYNIVSNSINTFDYGGWNVEEYQEVDLSPYAAILCDFVIETIPYADIVFAVGQALAEAMDKPEEIPTGNVEWYNSGRSWESNGFFQMDFYVEPDKNFGLDVIFSVWGSDDYAGDTSYKTGWDIDMHSPDEPTEATLRLLTNPTDSGKIKIDDNLYTHGSAIKIFTDQYYDLLANPYGGYTFSKWEDTNGAYIENKHSKSTRFKFTGDASIMAYFKSCCFPAGTKITLEDKSKKNIEDIKIGDRVLSFNPKTEEYNSWSVKKLGRIKNSICSINNGLILTTRDHPFYIKKSNRQIGIGAVDADMCKKIVLLSQAILPMEIGDFLFTEDKNWIEIKNITIKDDLVQTYNILSFSGNKTYFADGILVYEEHPRDSYSNRYLENILENHQLIANILFKMPFYKNIFTGGVL